MHIYGDWKLGFFLEVPKLPKNSFMKEMVSLPGVIVQQPQFYQNIVVMRHGDRIDNFEPLWTSTAARPWDPPLVEAGKVRAFYTGRRLRNQLQFPIHRIFVSPFLRCLQTASEIANALCSSADLPDDSNSNGLTSDGVFIDPSKVKVSIEYGLCEMMNLIAIRPNVAPKDGVLDFNISQCEAVLPPGTIDSAAEQLHQKLPKWQETVDDARARYLDVIKGLADKYPSENLLLVTHGEGIGAAVCGFVQDAKMIRQVEYCAYSHLRRPIVFDDDQSFTAGDLVGLPEGQVGLSYISSESKVASDDSLKK